MLLKETLKSCFTNLETRNTEKGTLNAWISHNPDIPIWDEFLKSSSNSHFYQSCMWGQLRIHAGWQSIITLITQNNRLIGGFQILWTDRSFIGKIGLLLKGPVLETADPQILDFVIPTLKRITKQNKIKALIVQPPNKDKHLSEILKGSGYVKNHVDYMIRNNTLVIDLHASKDELYKKINRKKRQNIRKAINCKAIIREGRREDINTFFGFMQETCKRHGVKPSPSNDAFLQKMWDIFYQKDCMKLFFIQFQSIDVSGLIIIPFGQTVYLWKFGWSGDFAKCHPNELLYWEIMKWAKDQGYNYADLDAVHSPSDTSANYSVFKRGLGGEVELLSNGLVYIPNPVLRLTYNLFMPFINSKPSLKSRLTFNN